MSQALAIPETQQFVLDGMTWRSYERALRTFDGRRVRISFSRGVLEIMTLSPEHERLKYLLARVVDVLVEELGWDSANFGSMTFKQRPKGMEPDECFWIAHELDVRGRDTLDPAAGFGARNRSQPQRRQPQRRQPPGDPGGDGSHRSLALRRTTSPSHAVGHRPQVSLSPDQPFIPIFAAGGSRPFSEPTNHPQ